MYGFTRTSPLHLRGLFHVAYRPMLPPPGLDSTVSIEKSPSACCSRCTSIEAGTSLSRAPWLLPRRAPSLEQLWGSATAPSPAMSASNPNRTTGAIFIALRVQLAAQVRQFGGVDRHRGCRACVRLPALISSMSPQSSASARNAAQDPCAHHLFWEEKGTSGKPYLRLTSSNSFRRHRHVAGTANGMTSISAPGRATKLIILGAMTRSANAMFAKTHCDQSDVAGEAVVGRENIPDWRDAAIRIQGHERMGEVSTRKQGLCENDIESCVLAELSRSPHG